MEGGPPPSMADAPEPAAQDARPVNSSTERGAPHARPGRLQPRHRRIIRRRAGAFEEATSPESVAQGGSTPVTSSTRAVLMTLGGRPLPMGVGGLPGYLLTEIVRRARQSRLAPQGNPPASEFAIESLNPALPTDATPTDICAVCQENLGSVSEAMIKKMPCAHCFHEACLVPWLRERNTCPVCRCQLESACTRYNRTHRAALRGAMREKSNSPDNLTKDPAPHGPPPPHPSGCSRGVRCKKCV